VVTVLTYPPFLLVQGACHLANWYSEGGLPDSWVIKPTSNGWTGNETGLDWIEHFDKHTRARTKCERAVGLCARGGRLLRYANLMLG
jgi:hypothetical protein